MTTNGGKLSERWEPCWVIGIAKDSAGEPAYIVEVTRDGCQFLELETELKRPAPRPA